MLWIRGSPDGKQRWWLLSLCEIFLPNVHLSVSKFLPTLVAKIVVSGDDSSVKQLIRRCEEHIVRWTFAAHTTKFLPKHRGQRKNVLSGEHFYNHALLSVGHRERNPSAFQIKNYLVQSSGDFKWGLHAAATLRFQLVSSLRTPWDSLCRTKTRKRLVVCDYSALPNSAVGGYVTFRRV